MAHKRYYSRLTRSRSGLGTYTSLWLGPDHLLLATSTGFAESYQRFYFRDIQCFAVADSIRSKVINIILGSLLGFIGLIALLHTLYGNGVLAAYLFLLLPFVIVLVWNLVLGRTCRVTLMSGVQSVVLPPLSRFNRTRRVFAKIVPLIEAAQSALVPPTIVSSPSPEPASVPPTLATPPVLGPSASPAPDNTAPATPPVL